jgi:hypothetical protein
MKLLITAPLYVSKQAHLDFAQETLKSIQESETKHTFDVKLVRNYISDDMLRPVMIGGLTSYGATQLGKNNPDGNNVAAGWNMGIKYGIEEGYDYILVINLDLIFREDCIDKLVDFAISRPEALVWTAGEWPDKRTFNDLKFKKHPDDSKKFLIKAGEETHTWDKIDEHPHFSCFMVNERTVRMLKKHEKKLAEPNPGYFDSNFKRAYFEDQDYHQRILMAGFDALRCNEALFYHYGSRTIKSDEQLEMENVHSYEGNRKYFKDKWGYDSHGMVPTNLERVKLAHLYPFNKPPDNGNV